MNDSRIDGMMAEHLTPLRVLIVDDEALIRWSLAETLTAAGHRVIEAGDSRSALEILRKSSEEFDVVLLDYRLPDSFDLQTLTQVRAAAPHSRVIMMTAYGSPEMTRSALSLGAFRVVHKPFDMRSARQMVEQAGAGG